MNKDIKLFCCPECGYNIEIDSAKIGYITFSCPNCEKNKKKTTIQIEKFLDSIEEYNSIKCSKCNKNEKEEKNLKYCSTHKLIICSKCAETHLKENEKKCNLVNNYKENLDKCSIHPEIENSCFCKTCKEHLCTNCLKDDQIGEKHLDHEKKHFNDDLRIRNINEFSENIEILKKEKNEKEDILLKNFKKKCKNEIKSLKIKKENEKKQNNKILKDQLKKLKDESNEETEKIKKKIEELQKQLQDIEIDRKNKENNINQLFTEKNKELENNYSKKMEEMEKKHEAEKKKLLQEDEDIKKIINTLKISNLIKNIYEKYKTNYYYNRNFVKISDYLKEVKNELKKSDNNIYNNNINDEGDIFKNMNSVKSIYFDNLDNNIKTPFDNLKNSEIIKKTNNKNYTIDNTFAIINLPNGNNYYIIYTSGDINEKKDLEKYNILCQNINLYEFTKIGEHAEKITGFRSIYDEKNKRILLMSFSGKDNNVKLWETKDFESWNQLLDLKNVNKKTEILSGCFMNYKNNIYLLASAENQKNDETIIEPEPIKVYDLEGNEIKDKNIAITSNINFIDTFYHKKRDKYYVILGCGRSCKYYNFEDHEDFSSFYDYEQGYVMSVVIDENRDIIIALGLEHRTIMGWEFELNGTLKFKIILSDTGFTKIGSSLCLWNNEYLLVGLGNNIAIIDLSPLDEDVEKSLNNVRSKINGSKEVKVVKILECDNTIKTIKKIENKNYIVSQTSEKNILLWK